MWNISEEGRKYLQDTMYDGDGRDRMANPVDAPYDEWEDGRTIENILDEKSVEKKKSVVS